ncbi:MAG: hypothetical protein JXA66_05890 [Oligoflexia bacterium]|nr:hypothetical protein [Oligoflexia bacterium]
MSTWKRNYLITLVLISNLLSCNLWKDFGDPSEKDAMIENAKICIDRGDYVGAIDILDSLAINFPTDPEIATLRSSAYAGAAGIGLLDIGFNMTSFSSSVDVSTSPFVQYLNLVGSPTGTELAYAIEARNSLIGFNANASLRSNEMNMYLTILSYGIVATVLSARGDKNPNDNRTDAGFGCSSIRDDDVLEIIYTYAVAKASIEYADGSSLWNGIEGTVESFTSALEAMMIDLSVTSKNDISLADCSIMKAFLVGGMLGAPEACVCSI